LKAQLTAGDILGQYLAVNRDLPAADRVTNIVFMGMGEPLDNYQPVVEAIRLLISPTAVRFPTRKVTLSTAGLVDKIQLFDQENLPVNLAVSLNATENRTRDQIMPINRKYPIEILLNCLEEYQIRPNRRITFEYVLLQGINDSQEDALRLARLLRRIPCKINLIPFNGFAGSPYRAPSAGQVSVFQDLLIARHYSVFVRKNRGTDILGACGQLAAESLR
ncbi:MAG: radical SAM protein, partial [Nitrospinaceae bacterium]